MTPTTVEHVAAALRTGVQTLYAPHTQAEQLEALAEQFGDMADAIAMARECGATTSWGSEQRSKRHEQRLRLLAQCLEATITTTTITETGP